jgi:L-fuconate dehydratase
MTSHLPTVDRVPISSKSRVVGLEVHDVRFATSAIRDGSDAVNRSPDNAAAYVVRRTDDTDCLARHGLIFTIEAVVNAAWDLAAKRATVPLWLYLSRLSSTDLVELVHLHYLLVDLHYLEDLLSRAEALEPLETAVPAAGDWAPSSEQFGLLGSRSPPIPTTFRALPRFGALSHPALVTTRERRVDRPSSRKSCPAG